MKAYFYEKLNQICSDNQQKEAYMANHSMVVLAGPGSGKTTVLTLKVMRLLTEKITEPRGLACVTYSREATREFKDRLIKLGLPNRKNIYLGTVHGFCLKEVIAPFAELYPQYRIPTPIKILSEKKKNAIFEKIKEDSGIDMDILKMDKERTQEIEGLSDIVHEPNPQASQIAILYENEIRERGFLDYISIVKYATILIQKEAFIRNCLEAKFPWIIIDEYQDLGKPLHEMILALITNTKIKYFAVGDPDQSIYDFQGASPAYLLELESKFTKHSLRLTNNYRSASKIVKASEVVLGKKRNYRSSGDWRNYNAEIQFITCEAEMETQYNQIVKSIIENYEQGIPYHEMAILCANKYQISNVCKVLKDNEIQFYISKHPFDNSDIIKWFQKCAGWVVGQAQPFEELFKFWKEINREKEILVDEKIIKFKKMLYNVLTQSKQKIDTLQIWIKYIVDELGIIKLLETNNYYPDEKDNIKKLLECLGSYPYINYNLLDFYNMGTPHNQVVVSTRHGSKGLEFDIIYMIGMEEGNFPNYKCSKAEEEESYRICFVCISRARKKCILLRSKYITIPTKNGLWYKEFSPCRFWRMLEQNITC